MPLLSYDPDRTIVCALFSSSKVYYFLQSMNTIGLQAYQGIITHDLGPRDLTLYCTCMYHVTGQKVGEITVAIPPSPNEVACDVTQENLVWRMTVLS